MMCAHKSCGIAEKVWHPYEIGEVGKGFKPHSYCIHCGTIKNTSSGSDKPKGIEYYINLLSEILGSSGKKRFTKISEGFAKSFL